MAARFWVGGTAEWNASNTTNWSATSGGAGGASVPGSADSATLDGASGGGTVTVNATITVQSITCGAFTGTLDFSTNNNNVTLSGVFSITGTGIRAINLGNGTLTLTGTGTIWNAATTTNLTFNANSSTFVFTATSGTARVFSGGGLTYNNLTVSANSSGGIFIIQGANTFANFSIVAPNALAFPGSVATTITNGFTWAGSIGSLIVIMAAIHGTISTISVASGSPTISYAGIRELTFTGGATFTATNSFNLGRNSGITITMPISPRPTFTLGI